MKSKRNLWALPILVAFAIATFAVVDISDRDTMQPAGETRPSTPAGGEIGTVTLAQLAEALPTIGPHESIPEYRRDSFGTRWSDVDGNGCDQRQDVLSRDLVEVTYEGCTVLTGMLRDPYTGNTIEFQHDRVARAGNPGSQGVQIDHIISLAAAHEGGAWQWSPQDRELFANQLTNLLAVDGKTNQSKSDRGPAAWMPPDPSYWCEYAAQYTQIATDWNLAVTSNDRDMLVDILKACTTS